MAGYPAYESYKDSGVAWIGDIPAGWAVVRSKYVWRETVEISQLGDEVLLSVSQYHGVIPRQAESRSEDLTGYRIVRRGELVSNIMLAWMGSLGVSRYDGIVSPAYSVYRLTADADQTFLDYLYRTNAYLAEFARNSTGVVPSRWRLYTENFGKILTLLPPLPEQRAIAAFLDEKCAKVDAAVRIKEQQIALLRERRQILIQHAVTHGLNPAAPMKDSGIDWIGQIPAHWEVKRVKQLCTLITKGTTPSTEGRGFSDAGVRYIKAENIVDGEVREMPAFFIDAATDLALSRSRLQAYDILFVIAGATIGKTAVLQQHQVPSNTNQAVALLRPKQQVVRPHFLHAWLGTEFVKNVTAVTAVQSAQPNISMENLGNIPFLLPNLTEQREILAYIDKSSAKINEGIAIKERQIAAFKEYKTCLINAAVTGKIAPFRAQALCHARPA